VYKELQKTGDARLEEHIQKSRIAQGNREAEHATEEEMDEVVKRWTVVEHAAKQPHLNRAQILAHDLSWKLHGEGKVKPNGEHLHELHEAKSEPPHATHHGLWGKLGHHHKALESEPATPPDAVQPPRVNAETAPTSDHRLEDVTS
jgi:hypothetical protein